MKVPVCNEIQDPCPWQEGHEHTDPPPITNAPAAVCRQRRPESRRPSPSPTRKL